MQRAALPVLIFVLLTGCEERKDAPALPEAKAFHEHVAQVIDGYPTDGTHGYHWPRKGTWLGFTRTLRYGGEVLGKGDAKARCHCSGLTFEVFFRAWERWCAAEKRPFRILDLDLEGVRALVRDWFGVTGDRATLHTAITRRDLGWRIEDREKAQPGDFVQLWRHSGSGHAAIVRGWVRKDGKIVGIRYWSTQSSTRGIGEREERFGKEGASVKPDELYLVRVGRKPEPASPPQRDSATNDG